MSPEIEAKTYSGALVCRRCGLRHIVHRMMESFEGVFWSCANRWCRHAHVHKGPLEPLLPEER